MVDRFSVAYTDWHHDPEGGFVDYSDYEALRSELEQVKRCNTRLQTMVDVAEDRLRNRRLENEAAERLAGARVKATSDELSRYIERCRELSDGGEYSWWSRLAEILSALAGAKP